MSAPRAIGMNALAADTLDEVGIVASVTEHGLNWRVQDMEPLALSSRQALALARMILEHVREPKP